ncbi:MAG: PAS domain S-box protein, partial [Deltaproteobacteria bacterium]|nr:PAS domain S-box protein [Deltaproteobacteria bacterium]
MEANIVKVLLIEDDKVDEIAFKRLVDAKNLPYDYTVARSVSEAMEILGSEKFDAIIADYDLGDGTAFDILDLMTDAPVIFATGAGDEEVAVKAMKMDAYDYLIKDQERNYLKMLPSTVANAIKHREAEENIRMLSHAMMGISDSVYITDKDSTIIFVNKAFCETYGYKREEILGQNCRLLWKFESADEGEEQGIPKRVEDGENDEFYHKRKDGSYFPVSLSKSPIKDKRGREVSFVVVVRDITKRKHAEEALRSAEAKSRLILQTMPSGLFTVDLQKKITSWNKEAEEI